MTPDYSLGRQAFERMIRFRSVSPWSVSLSSSVSSWAVSFGPVSFTSASYWSASCGSFSFRG